MATNGPLTNGVPPSSDNNTQSQQPPSQSQTLPAASQPNNTAQAPPPPPQPLPPSPTSSRPRPRDQRTIELLLTAQGVTSFESRIPLLLMDFAYRHTTAVLNDALHLSADPYTKDAGAKPSATAGGTASNIGAGGDATVSANAIQLAIQSRLNFQFRGGGGTTGGGAASKDTLLHMALERNKVALPRVPPSEWGTRLPNERFVLSGVGWGLQNVLARPGDYESSDEEDEVMGDAMDGVEGGGLQDVEDVGGDGVEGGTMEDMFGDDVEDTEMAEQ